MDMDLYARQLQQETKMAELGQERVRAILMHTDSKSRGSNKRSSQELATAAQSAFSDGLDNWFTECEAKRGVKPLAYKYLKDIKPLILMGYTFKVVLDTLRDSPSITSRCIALGKLVDDHIRLGELEAVQRVGMKRRIKELDAKNASDTWKRNDLLRYKKALAIPDSTLSRNEMLHVGMALINLLMETTDIVTRVLAEKEGKKVQHLLVANAELLSQLDERDFAHIMAGMTYLPMLVEPRPHDATSIYAGGYLSDSTLPFIKATSRADMQSIDARSDELDKVRAAVNAFQRTPWKINSKVLEIVRTLWANGGEVAGLPCASDRPMPPMLAEYVKDSDAAKLWKRDAYKIHTKNNLEVQARVGVLRTLDLAETYQPEAAIWFPAILDFRGRMYSVSGGFLSPQGTDLERGLLLFGNGEPVDAASFGNILVHAVGKYGNGHDKLSIDGRLQFARASMADMIESAEYPLNNDAMWLQADKPFSFLAACIEIKEYKDAEKAGTLDTFLSYLPCSSDGTCSGHQHYAAAGRDEVAGVSVNLTPGSKPGDLYMEVTNATIASLNALKSAEPTSDDGKLAQQLVDMGLDRKMSKTTVMVSVYSGTKNGAISNVEAWYDNRLETNAEGSTEAPWSKADSRVPIALLVDHMWDAIADRTSKAKELMGFVCDIARVLAKAGLPLNWVTADGLPVNQMKLKQESKQIETKTGGKMMKMSLRSDVKGKIDVRKQCQGAAPNFVHSLDANHLRAYVRAMEMEPTENPISYALVHDDFSVHARYAGLSAKLIRSTFVEMHGGNNFFEQLRARTIEALGTDKGVPEVPQQGSLDIDQVLESTYFFS